MAWDHRIYGSEGFEADPIQGHDCDVMVEDPGVSDLPDGVGKKILLGSFNSAVVTIRFSTEPYQTFRQRVNRLLDGDIQIAYVLERGWIDTAVHAQTFGFLEISRAKRINRSPRVQVTLNVDSQGELPTQFQEWYLQSNKAGRRMADGRLILTRCKMDSLHIAVSAGKQVGVNQWQGMAEGLRVAQPLVPVADTGSDDYIRENYQMDPRGAVNNSSLVNLSQRPLLASDTGASLSGQ